MILMLVPPLLFLAGLLCGGRPEHLRTLQIRGTGLVLGAFGVQWVLVRLPGTDPAPLLGLAFLGSHLLLLGGVWCNRRLPGLKVVLAGALLNGLVIAANGGFMPVTLAALGPTQLAPAALHAGQRLPMSKDVVVDANGAPLGVLGDSLAVGGPVSRVFSAGDVLVTLGLGLCVFVGTRPRWRRVPRPTRSLRPPGDVAVAGPAL